ncbi:Protein FAM166A, partial [Acanthisitta chloris]
GYTGYIPCFDYTRGLSYIPAVKKAVLSFDQKQIRSRNPPYTLGLRYPPSHWPEQRLHPSAGLTPSCPGCIPHLRLTYEDGTQGASQKEER